MATDPAVRRERLLEALQKGSLLQAAYAATLLGLDGVKEAAEPLLHVLETATNETLLGAAAEALGQLEERRALPRLQELLASHPSWRLRMECAQALGRIGDPAAASALEAVLLHDPHEYVRVRARQALAALGIEPLDEADDEDTPDPVPSRRRGRPTRRPALDARRNEVSGREGRETRSGARQ